MAVLKRLHRLQADIQHMEFEDLFQQRLSQKLFRIHNGYQPVSLNGTFREGLHNPRRSVSRQSRIHKVKPKVLFQRFFGRNAPHLQPLQAAAGRLPALQTHSSQRALNNSFSSHPQVAQGKQREQLRLFHHLE